MSIVVRFDNGDEYLVEVTQRLPNPLVARKLRELAKFVESAGQRSARRRLVNELSPRRRT